jgi:hypothetical protein
MMLLYQVATRLSLTTWCHIVELQDDNREVLGPTCNNSVERNILLARSQQAVDNLSTSWEQVVRTLPVDLLLEQHCCRSPARFLQLYSLCSQVKIHMRVIYSCSQVSQVILAYCEKSGSRTSKMHQSQGAISNY